MNPRQDALQIFNAALAAVQSAQLLPLHLSITSEAIIIFNHTIPFHSFNHIYVIGAGKAASAMAVATEEILGNYITDGLVVTKYGHALPGKKIRIIEGAHPVPDENCMLAVKATVQLLQKATKDDIVICLISGGASALWCDVPEGITLEEIQTTFDKLIKSGATIQEINTVRKHLSSIKGGQLVRYCNGAKLFSLIISDVPGDDVSVIASGPTVGDATTFSDAYAILLKYHLFHYLPGSIQSRINNGLQGKTDDTPKPEDSLFYNTINTIIGSNIIAIQAAATKAKDLGYTVSINNLLITGDAEVEAKKLVNSVIQYRGAKPACILQGGETTVKVTGRGRGGRNQHFVLAALGELSKELHNNFNNEILILSSGTDGTDGPTDATGAIGDNGIIQLASGKGLSIRDYLQDCNAYEFFQQTGGLIITGATQTNVMDVMLAIVY
jgi:glycerate 2-kinase